MTEPEFGANMKLWIHPTLYQQFRVVVAEGIFTWHILVSIKDCLNATAYLSILADCMPQFTTMVHSSFAAHFQWKISPSHKSKILADYFRGRQQCVFYVKVTFTITGTQSHRSTSGTWWTGRLESWMYGQPIYKNCEMQ